MSEVNEIEKILEDANGKLVHEVEIALKSHPEKIILRCGDGAHVYYSSSHIPVELRRVIESLPGKVGYSKEELLHLAGNLVEVIKRLPSESPNKLQPLYRKSDPKETKGIVNDWRSSLNSLNVFEGTQPVGELPYHEEEHNGTRYLILEDSGYVGEKP